MKKYFWGLAIVTLTLALAAQLMLHRGTPAEGPANAVWAFQPSTFSDAVTQAKVIVEAEVIAIAPGPDIVVPVSSEPSGVDRTITTHTTVRVLKTLKGDVAAGKNLVIFRTGGQPDPKAQAPSDPNATLHPMLVLDDDPPYQIGQRAFLLLEDGPNGTLRPVSPEGRYLLRADGTVAAVSGSTVSQSVNARPVADLEQAATGRLQIPNRAVAPSGGELATGGQPSK